ncbi:MAG TPA: bifunctional DNA-formamidopyrimidine glycosylase/DNA-(apurinic or apyrimidinic site) lyase [Rhizomicrobium sp.]|nr:bifunctional DNA-formamidopyrimidine glycosylase/DNA-(apurinic or apyrimidinic site) lyase [Rhizomicrobium sp.]
MPELPEVETVRLGLAPALEGHVIKEVRLRRGDLRLPFPPRFAERLTGRTVRHLTRRAKYLLAALDSGETLVIHLGMSGRMSVYAQGRRQKLGDYVYDAAPDGAGDGKHDHVVFETDAPARIVFNDHRRFGLMTLLPSDTLESDKLFKNIGVEPLSAKFNVAHLTKALAGKKTPIKSALLDQRLIAGLGNIYVCEALFRAGISPKRLAGSVKPERIAALVSAIKQVLKAAIAAGGSTLRDHAQATGDPGNFQHHFLVYGREGKACKSKCPGTVKRIVQAGRSTFYCPACQK